MQPNGGQGHVKRPSSTRNAPVSVPIGGQGHVKRPSSTRNSPVTTAPMSPPRDDLKQQPRKLSMFDRVADSMHHFGSSTPGGRRGDSREKDTLNKIKAKLEFQSLKVRDIVLLKLLLLRNQVSVSCELHAQLWCAAVPALVYCVARVTISKLCILFVLSSLEDW